MPPSSTFSPSLISLMVSVDVKPFTAMLAALSLGKRPMKVPNLKSFRLFFPPLREHLKGLLLKRTVLKPNLLQDHQIYRLRACMCALFSPEIFTGLGSEGVKSPTTTEDNERKGAGKED